MSNIDVDLKPGGFYVVTISALGSGFVLCLCPPRVFQLINPALSRVIPCKIEFSHLVFLEISFIFLPTGSRKSRASPWSVQLRKSPREATGAAVTIQTGNFCHFLCSVDSLSAWGPKPWLCWVTLQKDRQPHQSSHFHFSLGASRDIPVAACSFLMLGVF